MLFGSVEKKARKKKRNNMLSLHFQSDKNFKFKLLESCKRFFYFFLRFFFCFAWLLKDFS